MTHVAPASSMHSAEATGLEAEHEALQTQFTSLLKHAVILDHSLSAAIEASFKTSNMYIALQQENNSLRAQLDQAAMTHDPLFVEGHAQIQIRTEREKSLEIKNQALQAEMECLRAKLASVEDNNAILRAHNDRAGKIGEELSYLVYDLRQENAKLKKNIQEKEKVDAQQVENLEILGVRVAELRKKYSEEHVKTLRDLVGEKGFENYQKYVKKGPEQVAEVAWKEMFKSEFSPFKEEKRFENYEKSTEKGFDRMKQYREELALLMAKQSGVKRGPWNL